MKKFSILLLGATALSLTACAGTMDKLSRTGERPEMSAIGNPQTAGGYKPVSWPMPDPEGSSVRTSNSLWQPGSRAFFRDQRAARVGDILRINIAIADQAKLDNKTDNQRDTKESIAPLAYPLDKEITKYIGPHPGTWANITGGTSTNSTGKIDRKETINTQVAALVTQVLPNGNLVIEGTQEILVNYEIREVSVKGVIRPEDINSDNTIESNQIAQARIVYSGRGQISDKGQARWGYQVLEALSPF
jgi:flagellar L-ring protein precursor FlgH